MRRRHLQPVPAAPHPSSTKPTATGDPPDQVGRVLTTNTLTALLSRARPGGEISVERFERDDGTLIIYIDAADIVAFIYTGQPTDAGGGADPVVIDLHRRTEAGERRLQVLVDGTDARLLTIDPAQFRALASAGTDERGLVLVCARCNGSVDVEATGLLQALLDAAAAHLCLGPLTASHDAEEHSCN